MSTDLDTFGCLGSLIPLRGGGYFDLANPRPEQFTLAHVARGLAGECRYTNQTPYHYSVAEHSLWCLEVAIAERQPIEVQRAVLMHDAAEFGTGDISKPLKVLLGSAFRAIEQPIEDCIAAKWQLDFSHPFIKQVDRAMLMVERRLMWQPDGVEWHGERDAPSFTSLPKRLTFMSAATAESLFTFEAKQLGIE